MKKMIIPITVLIFLAWGCKKDQFIEPIDYDLIIPEVVLEKQNEVLFEFNDIDNNVYHAIKIGDQIWSQENLKTTRYNDGTPIPCIQGTSEWTALNSGAYCHYMNDPSYSKIYGSLYNYFAIESNKLAPKGWHVATVKDWDKLMMLLENDLIYSTNTTGFTALPNGYREAGCFEHLGVGGLASWWTSDQKILFLDFSYGGIFTKEDKPSNMGSGVRLVKDVDDSIIRYLDKPGKPENPEQDSEITELKDIDGNIYSTIKIGNLLWTQKNLKTTRYNDGTPIPCIQGKIEWATLKSGAYCHYLNDPENSEKYGLLYNYYAIASNKLAPDGWHVATIEDWKTSLAAIKIDFRPFNPSNDLGPLVDQNDWQEPFYKEILNQGSTMVTCTNSSGFTALPNGYRDISNSSFLDFGCLGTQASWWTSDRIMIFLDGDFGIFSRDDVLRTVGSGVRLVKDAN